MTTTKTDTRKYVLGFIFTDDCSHVLLINKNRPASQQGKMNGIGGKIEPGEKPLNAMARECIEECGLDIAFLDWVPFGEVEYDDGAVVYTYAARVSTKDFFNAQSCTDEKVESVPVKFHYKSPQKFATNTLALIFLAIQALRGGNHSNYFCIASTHWEPNKPLPVLKRGSLD